MRNRSRPVRHRDYLPTDPGQRGATIDAAVTGMTAAGIIAVFGATPLAIGVLIFQTPAGWESASPSANCSISRGSRAPSAW